jgi:hypothetical protein
MSAKLFAQRRDIGRLWIWQIRVDRRKRKLKLGPDVNLFETSKPTHTITRGKPSCALILGMVKEVLIAMSWDEHW